MASQEAPLSDILDELVDSAREDAVSIGNVLDAFQHRSLGVLLALFGLIALLPVIGDIPGMAILAGTLIVIAIAQSLLGSGGLWMPAFVRRRAIGRKTFDRGIGKARPWIGRMDRLLRPRLTALVAGRAQRGAISLSAALLALTFYPLAFVPFGVNAPAAGVLAFGLGLLACDGLMVLIGYAASGVTLYLLFGFL